MTTANGCREGLRTQTEEVVDARLPVESPFPDWLRGTFVGNGPGQFEVGGRSLVHWFDPLAMLRRFRFGDEDDGVLLSVLLEPSEDHSVLVCLDAATLSERGRAPLPHRLPYGFHGQFYGPTAPGRSMPRAVPTSPSGPDPARSSDIASRQREAGGGRWPRHASQMPYR